MSVAAMLGWAVVGTVGGVIAARIAEVVLAARDDAPPPPPRWLPAPAAAVGALLFPLAVGVVADDVWLIPAFLGFAWLTIALGVTDLRARLIPDRINLPGSVACAVLLAVGAFASGTESGLGRAALGAVIAAAFYMVLFIVGRGRSFGFGDVKLAPVLGLFTAFISWGAFGVGIFAGIAVGGLAAAVLLLSRLKAAQDHFAFGPALIVGAWVGLTLGDRIADWYLG